MVQLIQLGKVEKGAVSTASKFNSRNGRWFSQKKRSAVVGANAEGSRDVDDDICIQPNSLVQVKCNRGKSVSVKYYRVLSLFDKYYNKWWVPIDCKFPWTNDPLAIKNARVLLRLMKKTGSSFQEVQLEAGGDWGPNQVFCIKNYCDILDVDRLEEL